MQVFETIEGKSVGFNRLTRRQCMEITAKVWESRRRAILQDLNDAGASPTERLAALAELRKSEGGHGILIDHLRTAAGTDEVLALALAGNSGGHTVETINLGIERSIVLAMRLCGYEPIETPEGEPKGDEVDDDGFSTRSGENRREWMKDAAMIARVCPGFGPPLDLQVDEFDQALIESLELMKQWAPQ